MFLFSILISRTASYPHSDILDNMSCGERPSLEFNITSPSGHFVIHYDNYYSGSSEMSCYIGKVFHCFDKDSHRQRFYKSCLKSIFWAISFILMGLYLRYKYKDKFDELDQ